MSLDTSQMLIGPQITYVEERWASIKPGLCGLVMIQTDVQQNLAIKILPLSITEIGIREWLCALAPSLKHRVVMTTNSTTAWKMRCMNSCTTTDQMQLDLGVLVQMGKMAYPTGCVNTVLTHYRQSH